MLYALWSWEERTTCVQEAIKAHNDSLSFTALPASAKKTEHQPTTLY